MEDMFFRGHKVTYRRGYPIIYLPNHYKASKSGMVEIHYIVAEENLGRPLKKGEEVHHKDENKLNFESSNLIVFDSKASHSAYHACMRYGNDMVLTRTDGVWHCECITKTPKISKAQKTNSKSYICPICGGIKKSRDGAMCKLCSAKQRAANIPSKKRLVKDRETLHSFCAIGRKYNVSDNAVRKWFKKYDLPL